MIKYDIIIPHYKTGKMTAYCLHQIFKHSQGRDINVIVVDNTPNSDQELKKYTELANPPDFLKDKCFIYAPYPSDKLQSHGIAFDWAINEGLVTSDYFITLESDSFPTKDGWLDFYDRLIEQGYDMAGSKLKLSGGEYIHPAGAMWSLSCYKEAKKHVKEWYNDKYVYNANSFETAEFNYHSMVTSETQTDYYRPIAESVFHQGQGYSDESIHTYGSRHIELDMFLICPPHPQNIQLNYKRVGYEPGQWFSYWHYATGKKVYQLQTDIHWLPNRVNQQQEFTLTENGVKHLWGISAWHGATAEEMHDVIRIKAETMESLYNSII